MTKDICLEIICNFVEIYKLAVNERQRKNNDNLVKEFILEINPEKFDLYFLKYESLKNDYIKKTTGQEYKKYLTSDC